MSEAKNLCRVCSQDFCTLTLFDLHRKNIRISLDGITGKCIKPQKMGLVKLNGVWYDESGLRQLDKMEKMRDARRG